MEEDSVYRGNAILMQGSPISHLPTTGLFAYATHFQAQPLALEWINDNTCIFVFETKTAAKTGYRMLQKSPEEVPDADEFVTSKPIPMACWPAEERIKKSLDQGEGLKGILRMRWARNDDVKKKGAKKESEFYRKHGSEAGKVFDGRTDLPAKRRRRDDHDADDALEKAKLDEDLDNILAQSDDEPERPSSPPSKMRSDYIGNDGRTLLERTSLLVHTDLQSRLTAPLPRRRRHQQPEGSEGRLHSPERDGMNNTGRRREKTHGGRRNARPRPAQKTQQELDDELDAFLNEGR
ncbi:hypothetical protein BDN72DRAFT_50571 [Pluteus cervinus]|uniref:Uncharacterized protein n=1 Tax=Pluteus cervinus TaxID=181527 RepID=A0ACD3B8E7_9AGAR|nr:hypothetical protein BDN72DRAFT_50571 [Pluteus cervinus]